MSQDNLLAIPEFNIAEFNMQYKRSQDTRAEQPNPQRNTHQSQRSKQTKSVMSAIAGEVPPWTTQWDAPWNTQQNTQWITKTIAAHNARLAELAQYANIKPLVADIKLDVPEIGLVSVNKMLEYIRELHKLKAIERDDLDI